MIEKIKENLSEEEVNSILARLDETGLKFNRVISLDGKVVKPVGHINVKEPRKNHPKYNDVLLPVGFIGRERSGDNYCIQLVNTDLKFPEDYHERFRRLCA